MSTESELADGSVRWKIQTDANPPLVHSRITESNSYGPVNTEGVQTTSINTRTARIARDPAGEPLSIVLVASPEDLRSAGVDLDGAEAVEYGFVNGTLLLRRHD